MRKTLIAAPVAFVALSAVVFAASQKPATKKSAKKVAVSSVAAKNQKTKKVAPVLNFKMKSLAGKEIDLAKYAGKVVLIVNTASKCGYTPQYAGLQELHKKYSSQGLAILGFPANNFGAQEPGSNEEISGFCEANFGVKFDMFSKVSVKGDDQAPLFKYLTSPKTDPKFSGDIAWNFEKFLIGRNGQIVNRFKSNVAPDADEMKKAIEAELAKR